MKSRASIHLLIMLVIITLTFLAYYTIYRSAMIRGYEPSLIYATRNLLFFVPLLVLPLFLTRGTRFRGNFTLLTTAMLLYSFGLVGQYRLFSDPEYAPTGKAEAREMKMEALQMRYIRENYSVEKKRVMGMENPAPPAPTNLDEEKRRESKYSIGSALGDVGTWITLFALLSCPIAYLLFRRDSVLDLLQNNGFLLVLLTLPPMFAAVLSADKNHKVFGMTPWELAKIPFLLGFAAILTILYKNLTKTRWGVPRARDIVPLVFMGIIPFVPFFVLNDFGQMLVFSSAYITLYLIAVKRLPQRVVFVGSVLLVLTILTLAALPSAFKPDIPVLSTIAEPVRKNLPSRIHQRFYLWFDALTPPPNDTFWWKNDFERFYAEEYKKEIIENNPDLQAPAAEVARQVQPLEKQIQSLPPGDPKRRQLQKQINEIEKPLKAQIRERAVQELDEKRRKANPEIAPTDAEDPDAAQIDPEDADAAARAAKKEQEEAKEFLDSLNEEAWFGDDAMQAARATFGLSTGGKTGRGLGLGYVELIPVADSDYIYAAIGEEMGLFGGLLITLALIVFVAAGTRTALDARDMFTKLCAAGLTAFIGFQGLVNIGGITRALPMTGITLPFVSHGGFSLIASFAMLGMLLAISHRNAVDAQQTQLDTNDK